MRTNGIRSTLIFVALLACALQTATLVRAAGPVVYEKDSAYGTVVITDEGNNMRALRF